MMPAGRRLHVLFGAVFLAAASVRRFRRDQNGATAVEFAIVSIPFFALMFAILETALMFFSQQALETAVGDAGRLVRTGQAQQQGFDKAAFRSAICSKVFDLFDCEGGLRIEVRTFPKFSDLDYSPPLNDEGNLVDDDELEFDIGEANQIVLVRTFYEYPVYVTGFGNNFSNLANGKYNLSAAAAFRNEPFPW